MNTTNEIFNYLTSRNGKGSCMLSISDNFRNLEESDINSALSELVSKGLVSEVKYYTVTEDGKDSGICQRSKVLEFTLNGNQWVCFFPKSLAQLGTSFPPDSEPEDIAEYFLSSYCNYVGGLWVSELALKQITAKVLTVASTNEKEVTHDS